MSVQDGLISIAGVVLVVVTLIDVALTVLHTDLNGPLGEQVHQAIWRVIVRLSRWRPRWRSMLLSLSGPLMMLAMFMTWAALYIIGFALVVWPQLSHYRTASGQDAASFIDALYYSGVTATVLGFGDITPRVGSLQAAAVLQAAMGFAMFSGVVTWLIQVVSGVSVRDAMALHVRQSTEGTNDGLRIVERYLVGDNTGQLVDRLSQIVHDLQQLQPKLRQFPVLDLHYRSRSASLAPELMLRALAQAAIAGQLVAQGQKHVALQPAAADLDRAVTEVMCLIARQHLPHSAGDAIEHASPQEADRATVQAMRQRLLGNERDEKALRAAGTPDSALPDSALLLACRLRLWLDAMDHESGWRLDDDA